MKGQDSKTLKLKKEVFDRLMRICAETGKSPSEVILDATMNFVKLS